MCLRFHTRSTTLVLAISVLFVTGKLEANSDWRERFEREAASAWLDYIERAKFLQGSISVVMEEVSPEKSPESEVEMIIKRAPRHALVRYNSKRRQGKQTVRASNPLYAFELERDSPDEGWIISDLDLDLTNGLSLDHHPEDEIEARTAYPVSFAGIAANRYPTTALLEPGFEAKEISPIERDGETLVQIDFDYRPPPEHKVPELSGWIACDPTRSWVIRAFDINTILPDAESPIQARWTGTYTYRETDNGFPLLQQADQTLDNIKAQVKYKITRVFDLHFEDPPPKSAFHLTAFGFPEPNDVVRPTPWFLYSLIAGVALLVIAFALYKWAARPARRGA